MTKGNVIQSIHLKAEQEEILLDTIDPSDKKHRETREGERVEDDGRVHGSQILRGRILVNDVAIDLGETMEAV